eukprot:TRINITY_DN15884_c0_g1_i2.p1 TRINITY_DN15884_c0_g1~~TRINITY_DN15884_c0_g1_i2.p1  ORF type:complete len:204 (+),score=46.67 TRINITY_DN15884_c0_g1_i2:301-912(+)
MTTTYAGQFAMSGFFDIDMPAWAVVSITRVIALGPACIIALAAGSNAGVSADMNEWLNTLQSLQLPFALLPVLHFTNSKRVMGVFANTQSKKVMYWVIGLGVIFLNLYFVIDFFYLDDTQPIPHNPWIATIVAVYLLAYCFFVGAVVQDEIRALLVFLRILDPKPPVEDPKKDPLAPSQSASELDQTEELSQPLNPEPAAPRV